MELAELPQQLSPAILGVLLDGLIEYNGVTFRDVPLRTFRGKIVGLYFASIDGEGCSAFVDRLRAFYGEMNHQFEVVLVSCDGSDEAYNTHAQSTAWPAYPRGDYRISLLKSHFNVLKCPRLIILDSNGVCVTAEGVAMLDKDPHGRCFPWIERPIEMLFSSNVDGELQQVLSRLELPPHNGVAVEDVKIVCLLFGELWCPDSRDLIRRIQFLGSKMQRCTGAGELFSVYHIHNDDMEKYQDFEFLEDLPFVSVKLQDEELRKAVFHFFGVHQRYPSFCVTCPSEDWVIRDGVEEIRRDPTGVCFPWRPLPPSNQPLQYIDILKPVQEEDLVHHLCRGPVFIALMHQVHALKDEAMSNIRAAAMAYLNLGTQPEESSQFSNEERHGPGEGGEEVDVVGSTVLSDEHGMNTIRDLTELSDHTFAKMKKLLLCPPSQQIPQPLAEKSQDGASERTGSQQNSQSGRPSIGASHGNAPWNAPMSGANTGRVQFPFLYTSSNSRVAQILQKFCNFDEKTVRQHQCWIKQQMKIQKQKKMDEMERQLRLDGLEMMSKRASVGGRASQLSHTENLRAPEDLAGEDAKDTIRNGNRSLYLPKFEFEEEDSDSDDEKEYSEEDYKKKMNVSDDLMLGDGQVSTGCGVIVDLACGTYHVCGSLIDTSIILHFLDRWERGKLVPLEIRVPNNEELLEEPVDSHNQPKRQPGTASQNTRRFAQPQNLPDNAPRCMPGIVIWIPTKQHSTAGMDTDVIYRALLKHAYHKCPTDDDAVQAASLGRSRHDPDEPEGRMYGRLERLVQRIQKFWIFGLEDGGDNKGIGESDAWEPPGSEFLAELRELVERNIQLEQAKLANANTAKNDDDSEVSFTGSRKHLQWDKDDHDSESKISGETKENVFDPGIDKLRKLHVEGSEPAQVIGNHNLCMYTSKSKQGLYSAIIDELSYYTAVQSPPPPLFVLMCGDLPVVNEVPWPAVLQGAHVQLIGSVQGLSQYRELVSPTLNVTDWAAWLENYADDHINNKIARHLQVPWS